VDITIDLYDLSVDPANRIDENVTTINCSDGNFFVQATTELNLPKMFELFGVPFKWGHTKVRAFLFPEIYFGCPSYTLIFALPLQPDSRMITAFPDISDSLVPGLISIQDKNLTRVFSYLSVEEILCLSSVSQAWHTWITKNQKLWKLKHDEIWDEGAEGRLQEIWAWVQPVEVLTNTVGWYVVVVLKKKRERDFKKGLCTKVNEFELDLGKLYEDLPEEAKVLGAMVFRSWVGVLREEEVSEFAKQLWGAHLEVSGVMQQLYLNNLKFYFLCCAKSKQPMFVIYKGTE